MSHSLPVQPELAASISEDPLGKALLDYLQQENDQYIIVHSDIAEGETMIVSHFFRTAEQLSELEHVALSYCRGRVLDIGAGAGTHALILQDKGLSVTAVDLSPGAVAVMKQRGVQDVHCLNFMDWKTAGYDTLLLMMNGIGLAGTLEGLEVFLQKAKTLLNPGGQILLDSVDILYMYEDEEGGYWLDLNGAYHGEITYQMEYNEVLGEEFPWLFVSFDILCDYAEAAGFQCDMLLMDAHEQYIARLILSEP